MAQQRDSDDLDRERPLTEDETRGGIDEEFEDDEEGGEEDLEEEESELEASN